MPGCGRASPEVLVDAGHDPQHRRLARAVQAQQADLGAGEEGQRDVLDDLLLRRHDLADADHRVDVLHRGRALAVEHRPKMVVAGFSAYSQVVDWARFRAIADKVGALLFVDMAHVAGLVAAGRLPEPAAARARGHLDHPQDPARPARRHHRGEGADRGAREEAAVDRLPRHPGRPLMHVIAAKAVAFKEALEPEFKAYQQQVVKNAQAMAKTIIERGYKIVSGGTENHLMLVDMIGARSPARTPRPRSAAPTSRSTRTRCRTTRRSRSSPPACASAPRRSPPAATARPTAWTWPTGCATCSTRRPTRA
jgi:hypothetical protein